MSHASKVALAALVASTAHADEAAVRQLAALDFPMEARVAFTERRTSRLLRRPLVSQGVAWIEADGGVVMRVHTPRLEERRIEGDRLVLRRPRQRRPDNADRMSVEADRVSVEADRVASVEADSAASVDEVLSKATPRSRTMDLAKPMQLGLWAAARVLLGETDAVLARFAVTGGPSGTPGGAWRIELTPRDDRLRELLQSIHLSGRANRVERVAMGRGKDGRYELAFAAEPAP